MTLEQLIQNESRHAVLVNRYAGGLHRDFLPTLKEIEQGIVGRVLSDYSTDIGRRKLNALVKDISLYQRTIYDSYLDALTEELQDFAIDESQFEVESLKDFIEVNFELPAPNQVLSAVARNPLIFPDSNNVVLLKPFLDGYQDAQIKRIEKVVRTGFYTGETVDSMARSLRQTTKQARHANRAIVRTAVNHASSQARTETLKQNDDVVIGYTWISTLDDRTSAPCRSLDGKEFKWSDKYQPLPPIHVACRSATVPLLAPEFVQVQDDNATRASKGAQGGKPISASTSYYTFLKQQPKAFQDDVLGKTKAKLMRDGGLTAEQFAKLTVDEKFRPLTLQEMRDKQPQAFERANLN